MIGVSDGAAAEVPEPVSVDGRKRGRVSGAPSAEWSFPADPGAVRTARTMVRQVLDDWGLNGAADVAVLLVSELVTNSLRYASGPIGVRMVLLGAGGLLVEVSDPLPDPPRERTTTPDDEGGRGLQLVACSARRWGTRRGKTGKTVWFELSVAG
ncbi:ATP-binding protein [Streptomyces sp. GS7]|uniref:ATP-binding protein n=1 Tax=Streptomyces sp. GS7 TaxID=2692234 RepID=UPI00131863BD|nr:ATP-binding protein [Streptomyces sp. GS7]QHC25627.1 ATP-binding protein [Streptomyces sp. GS7]